jgi:hypothetical protein
MHRFEDFVRKGRQFPELLAAHDVFQPRPTELLAVVSRDLENVPGATNCSLRQRKAIEATTRMTSDACSGSARNQPRATILLLSTGYSRLALLIFAGFMSEGIALA